MRLSALMAVYGRESPVYLAQALHSLTRQTRPADEVVLVKDGPLGEALERVLARQREVLPIAQVALPRPMGLGAALREGVACCRGELVARVDSDDLCVAERFALQLAAFAREPELDALGGAIDEFAGAPERPHSRRRVPTDSEAVRRWARTRNPMNHMTVMFRRRAVLEAGSYQPFPDFEDYHLWVRMLLRGSRLRNLPEVLVHARAGEAMLARRGGWSYLANERAFQSFLCRSGFVSPLAGLGNLLLRAPVRFGPSFLRRHIYGKLLRSRAMPSAPAEMPR